MMLGSVRSKVRAVLFVLYPYHLQVTTFANKLLEQMAPLESPLS